MSMLSLLFPVRLRRRASIALLPVVVALTAGSTPVLAQAAGGFGEVIDVELVNVDVWVTDSSGEPVAGLAAGDFEVLHDGRPVDVAYFREIRGGAAVAAAAAVAVAVGEGQEEDLQEERTEAAAVADAAAPPTHVVVYFDQTRLRASNYEPLIRSLRAVLATRAIAAERVLVLRQTRGLFVELPFGSSEAELDAALSQIAKSPPAAFDSEAETRLAVDAIRDTWEQSRDSLGSAQRGIAGIPTATPGEPGGGAGAGGSPRDVVSGGFGTSAGPDACGSFVSQIQSTLDAWSRRRSQSIDVTLSNLTDTASFLAGIPGVKILLYLSDGLETEPGTDLATYAAGLCPAGSAELLTSVRGQSMTDRFLELTRHANSNRVTIHALQTSGLRGSDFGDASSGRQAGGPGGASRGRGAFESSRRTVERQGLTVLAGETGGRAIFNRNDFETELVQIGQDAVNYYSLAYEPPASDAAREREHRIEVRVAGRGRDLRFRRGYLEKDDRQWLGERVEGALNLGITDNALGVRLAAAEARREADGSFVVPLHVILPAERLAFLPNDGGHLAVLSIQVMARHAASSTLTVWDRQFRVRGTPGTSGWADLTIELELAAGVHVTAVGVRDEATREASFLSTTLDVGG